MSVLKHKENGEWVVVGALPRGLHGLTDPTSTTIAEFIGLTYVNTTSGILFVCKAITGNVYDWVQVSGDELVPATTTTLGGIIVGDNLTVDSEGVLDALAGIKDQPEAPTGANDKFWLDTDEPGYMVDPPEYAYNKVQTVTSSSTADQYPSAKCVYDALGTKQDNLPQVVNNKYLHTNETTGALEWNTPEKGEYASVDNNKLVFTEEPVEPVLLNDASSHNITQIKTSDNVTNNINDYRLPSSLGTANQVLKMNSGASVIEWGTINIPTYTAGDGISITDNVITNTDHALVPAQATEQNQLADKAFVNSSVQTATANFRGSWNNWAAVPTDASLYPQDYAGSTTPTTNDYIAVIDASDFRVENPLSGTWRFKYTGIWSTAGKSGWTPEYQINREPLTAAQIAALNSGITSGKVSTYDGYATGKEDVGYLTLGGTKYQIRTSTTDEGAAGYITFVIQS